MYSSRYNTCNVGILCSLDSSTASHRCLERTRQTHHPDYHPAAAINAHQLEALLLNC